MIKCEIKKYLRNTIVRMIQLIYLQNNEEQYRSELASHQDSYVWGGKLNIIISPLPFILLIIIIVEHKTQSKIITSSNYILNPTISTKTMAFISQEGSTLQFKQIFNEQHAALIIEQQVSRNPNFDTILLHNVGIKIMKDIFQKFSECPFNKIQLYYNWNQIMMMPKLVSYDKNTWKTLQQVANWNRQWSLVFKPCYSLQGISMNITISWVDEQFVKSLIQGLSSLPNLKEVSLNISSKNEKVGEMLNILQQSKPFPTFKYEFSKYSEDLKKNK